MFCSKCGEKIGEEVKFCPKCGHPAGRNNVKENGNTIQQGERAVKKSSTYFVLGVIVIGVILLIVLAKGVLFNEKSVLKMEKTDVEKLEGTWQDEEGNQFIFYAPNEKDGDSGDGEFIENDEPKIITYECHESSQQLIITGSDNWGDTVHVTYKYEITDDTQLEVKVVGYADSVRSVSDYDGETIVFYKEEE